MPIFLTGRKSQRRLVTIWSPKLRNRRQLWPTSTSSNSLAEAEPDVASRHLGPFVLGGRFVWLTLIEGRAGCVGRALAADDAERKITGREPHLILRPYCCSLIALADRKPHSQRAILALSHHRNPGVTLICGPRHPSWMAFDRPLFPMRPAPPIKIRIVDSGLKSDQPGCSQPPGRPAVITSAPGPIIKATTSAPARKRHA